MKKITEKDFYKEKIIEMVEGIENPKTLEYIYHVIKAYLKSRGI